MQGVLTQRSLPASLVSLDAAYSHTLTSVLGIKSTSPKSSFEIPSITFIRKPNGKATHRGIKA